MIRHCLLVFVIIGLCLGGSAFAEEGEGGYYEGQVVRSPRLLPELIRDTAHSVSVVPGDTLQSRVDRDVSEGVQELPGVFVQPLGTPGETTNVRLRGATNADTLVLLDGVRLNNPGTNETNLSLIPVELIDHIEVLKGSQATLYGGSAVGGVIAIYTKKGMGDSEFNMGMQGGNLGYTRELLTWSGEKNPVAWSLGVSRTDLAGQFANDAFKETALTQHWNFKPHPKMDLEITSHIFLTDKNLARGFLISPAVFYDPALPPDGAFLQLALTSRRAVSDLLTTESLKLGYDWNSILRTEFFYGFFLSDQEEQDSRVGDPGYTTPSGLVLAPNSALNRLRTSRSNADLRNFFFIPRQGSIEQVVTAGFEYYLETVRASGETFPGDPLPPPGSFGPVIPPLEPVPAPGVPGSRQNYAPYLQYHLSLKELFFLDAGFRWDINSDYGQDISPRAAIAVHIPKVKGKFHASYGEGFLPPTVFQLFNPITGNPDLRPQTSQSYDVGYEQPIGSKAMAYATFFYLDFDNLISRLGTNTNDALSTGVEAGVYWNPIPQLRIGANYTFTHTRDESGAGQPISNVPENMFNATVSASPWRTLTVDSVLSVVGQQFESFPIISAEGAFLGGSPSATLAGGFNPGWVLWDLSLSYSFSLMTAMQDHPQLIKVFGSAKNILNQEYSGIFGFPSPRFNFVAGAEMTF